MLNSPVAISVIVPVHKATKNFTWLIGRLARQKINVPYEVLIAEDNSPDDTADRIAACIARLGVPHVKLFKMPVNLGPAGARNYAMAKAKGELFVLIDADCIIYDYQHLARLYQAHLAFPHAIIGGAIDGKGRSYAALADHFCHWRTNIPGAEAGPVNSGHLVTAHMLIPRSSWKRLGPFSQDLRTGEDTAFCLKARRHGIQIRLHGDIVLGHYDRETWKDFLSCFYAVGRDRAAVRSAAHGASPWYLSGPVLLRWLLVVPIAGALTFQHLRDWWPHDKRVVWALPAIFIGMLAVAVGVAIGKKE